MTNFHLTLTHSPLPWTGAFLSAYLFHARRWSVPFVQKHLQCLHHTTGGHVTLTRPLDDSFWDMSRIREGTVSKNRSAPSHKHAVWSGNQTSMLSFWANPNACLDILPMFPPAPSVFSGCSVGPKMAFCGPACVCVWVCVYACVFLMFCYYTLFHFALLNTIAKGCLKHILLLLGLHHLWCSETIHLSVRQRTSDIKISECFFFLVSFFWMSFFLKKTNNKQSL